MYTLFALPQYLSVNTLLFFSTCSQGQWVYLYVEVWLFPVGTEVLSVVSVVSVVPFLPPEPQS